jgi:hypothetical protein
MSQTEQKVRSLLNVMDSFPDKDRGVVETAEMREICRSWLELHRERDEARARVTVLEDALRTFGLFADSYDADVTHRYHADNEPFYTREMNTIGKREIAIGDFRRARAVLQERSK